MLRLCRLRAITVPLARANSTLEPLSSVVSTSPPKRTTQGRRKPKYSPIRPSISLERPREWNPPVAPGFIPAYDEAVAYIRADAAAVRAEVDNLRSSLENGHVPTEGIEDAKERLDVLEIMAQVNLPEVRWKAANGMGSCCYSTLSKTYLTGHLL
jgi:large subunit ribosomal protein L35